MRIFKSLLLLGVGFTWGLLVMNNQWFPYHQLKAVKQVFSFSQSYQATEHEIRYYSRKVSQHKLLSGQAFDAVFIGDSLIDEMDWAQVLPARKVANLGINADTIGGLLKRVETLDSIDVSKLFLLIGVNDLLQGQGLAEIALNYKAILDHLERKGRTVYLMALYPLGAKYEKLNEDVMRVNHMLQGFAQERPFVYFIDTHTTLLMDGKLNPLFSNDDLHLNAQGYRRIVGVIESYL